MPSRVQPTASTRTDHSQTKASFETPYSAMEGLFIYTANKLEAIRTDSNGQKAFKILSLRELKLVSLWRAVFAEFLAQILFVFLGGASAMFTDTTDPSSKIIKIAFSSGLSIMALIQMIGHVSGGHINPAVTIAMAVAMNISIIRALLYIVAQIVGAIVGGFILKGLTPSDFHGNLAVTSVATKLTAGQGLGVEIILTFVLVAVIFGTTDSNRPSFGSPALLIGLTVTLLHLAGVSFTGASMNPSRSLGSAVVSNSFNNHWVYWVGPILGGILAAAAYKLIICPYRNTLSMEEAIQKMLQDDNLVVIPRDYLKGENGGKNRERYIDSSNL